MFDPATLDRPIVPPPGVGDPRPVLEVTHKAAIGALRSLAMFITAMADSVERDPWSDVMADLYRPAICTAADVAEQRLAIFKATRDCEGMS